MQKLAKEIVNICDFVIEQTTYSVVNEKNKKSNIFLGPEKIVWNKRLCPGIFWTLPGMKLRPYLVFVTLPRN
jgi:hypothetical protein